MRTDAEGRGQSRWDPSQGDFRAWWDALTVAQQEQLVDKARWEQMTLSAVAKEWGVDV